MIFWFNRYCVLMALVGTWMIGNGPAVGDPPAAHPPVGSLYREYSLHNGGNNDWRVTDDQAVVKFKAAEDHLPNPTLRLTIDDLEHATAAEVMIDRWGGHRGTISKRIQFNGGDWIIIPEIGRDQYGSLPENLRGEMLMFQDNPVVNVPLADLHEGINELLADCDESGGFGWGQWGLYSATVRIYYDPEAKSELGQIDGKIVYPSSDAAIGENPEIVVDADAAMGVSRIDVLAGYDGYDEDGDGDHGGYHEGHFQPSVGAANEIAYHVGTVIDKPYRLNWSTAYVPDQLESQVWLIARVQNSRGYWTVTPPVTATLRRPGTSVRTFHATDVPEDFAVRVGETKNCVIHVPDDGSLDNATDAVLHLRTWHGWDGHHQPLRFNEYEFPVDGKNHHFDYDRLPIPISAIRPGQNIFAIHSDTEHHMLEVLWPGPSLTIRYADPPEVPQGEVSIQTSSYEGRPHHVITTPAATYWLDDASGGLSRMIAPDGRDWIGFKKEPWNRYPASAASSYRGLPNALHGGESSGFGHPGWDVATTQVVGERYIRSISDDGQWTLHWQFEPDHVDLAVTTTDAQRPYWFLYEGPIAGRFAPGEQQIVIEGHVGDPSFITSDDELDFYAGRRYYGRARSMTLTDQTSDYHLRIEHRTADHQIDTASYLGDTERGIRSDGGMVVVGFGRGRGTQSGGIEPLLRGPHQFRIQMENAARD